MTASQPAKADLILHDAHLLTLEPARPRGSLLAVVGGRILAVGDERDLESVRGPETRVVDGQGRTLVPGFVDAHLHFFALAASLLAVDCRPARSIADIQARIGERAGETPPGDWVRATGYHEHDLAEKRHPSRRELDAAAPHHPVRLAHRSGHALVLNSLALAQTGIARETPDPPEGVILRDETGEPTGVLLEMNDYVGKRMPPLSQAERDEGTARADRLLLSQGITSFGDATASNGLAQWQEFQRLLQGGRLHPWVTMMLGHEAMPEMLEAGLGPGAGDEQLRLGAVKFVLTQTTGTLYPPQPELNRLVLAAHRAGFQVAIHALEVEEIAAALEALEHAWQEAPRPHRHRLEHGAVCPPALQEKLARLRVAVVTQPSFLYHSGQRYLATVPPEAQPWLYPLGSLWEKAVALGASSDAPVAPPNPLLGVYAAVTRRAATGEVLQPQQALSASQALAMPTIEAAYASFQEAELGSLKPGKLADFVVLSGNPLMVPPEKIKDIRVEQTFIGGKAAGEGEPL